MKSNSQKTYRQSPRRRHLNSCPSSSSNDNAPVEVYAWARTAASDDWQRILKFRNKDGKKHTVLLSPEEETPARLLNVLRRHGCTLPPDRPTQASLVDGILRTDPKRRVLLVHRFGWQSDQFLLGTSSKGIGREPIMISEMLRPHLARVARRGKLKDWQDNIAAGCTVSSYLIFALCVGFGAPLLYLTGVESGGFHFWGPSSKGKTTLESCVGTIFGSGEGHDNGYSRSWKTTDTALEEIALGHCDLPLILDELQLLDADPKNAAQRASDIAYSIASGTGKARSMAYKGSILGDLKQYRTLLISSGEVSLVDHAGFGGAHRLRGEEGRLIDIPIPNRPTGICDRLPEGTSGQQSRECIERLDRNARRYFGVAGDVFLEHLVNDVSCNAGKLKTQIMAWMNRFYLISHVDMNDGYQVRFARRFALAYAAGLLAIYYGTVPWKAVCVKRCVRRCYWGASHRRAEPTEPIRAAAQTVLCRVREAKSLDLRRTRATVDPKLAQRANVLLITHSDGSIVHAVRPDYFRSLVGRNVSARYVARELERRGLLIPRSNGRRTLQLRIPGLKGRRDYYCLIAGPKAK